MTIPEAIEGTAFCFSQSFSTGSQNFAQNAIANVSFYARTNKAYQAWHRILVEGKPAGEPWESIETDKAVTSFLGTDWFKYTWNKQLKKNYTDLKLIITGSIMSSSDAKIYTYFDSFSLDVTPMISEITPDRTLFRYSKDAYFKMDSTGLELVAPKITVSECTIGSATVQSDLTIPGGATLHYAHIEDNMWAENSASFGWTSPYYAPGYTMYVYGGLMSNGDISCSKNIECDNLWARGDITASGDIIAAGDIISNFTSDKRLKENIVAIQDSLEKINQLTGYEFDWDPDYKPNLYYGHDVGLIAQEVKKVIPEAVVVRNDGYYALEYHKIIPVLVNSINEQQVQINNQQIQINNQRLLIEELKTKIEGK